MIYVTAGKKEQVSQRKDINFTRKRPTDLVSSVFTRKAELFTSPPRPQIHDFISSLTLEADLEFSLINKPSEVGEAIQPQLCFKAHAREQKLWCQNGTLCIIIFWKLDPETP